MYISNIIVGIADWSLSMIVPYLRNHTINTIYTKKVGQIRDSNPGSVRYEAHGLTHLHCLLLVQY